jgi:hypothetical protein
VRDSAARAQAGHRHPRIAIHRRRRHVAADRRAAADLSETYFNTNPISPSPRRRRRRPRVSGGTSTSTSTTARARSATQYDCNKNTHVHEYDDKFNVTASTCCDRSLRAFNLVNAIPGRGRSSRS